MKTKRGIVIPAISIWWRQRGVAAQWRNGGVAYRRKRNGSHREEISNVICENHRNL
jgi:hypothetical protein